MPRPALDLGALPSLDDVEFVERLGAGLGAGRFKARLGALGTPVALLLEDASVIERAKFAAWGRTMSKLDHQGLPNVVRVEDAFEPGFVAFEYVDGTNLEARLALRGEGLPELDALATVLQAAATIRAAHAAGIAHGALNLRAIVLVERAGGIDGVRVVGWAPATDRPFETLAREDLRALGTLLYVSLTGVQPPSSQRLDDEGLEGGGGAFDDILMDWVDVDRDLKGLGRPALDALADSGRYANVDAFVDALLPHFRQRVKHHLDTAAQNLDDDRAFMAEVERQRARLRELEVRQRALRDWLHSHAARIERCDTELDRLRDRVRALQSLETEMGLLAGRSGRRPAARLPDRFDALDRRRADWSDPPAGLEDPIGGLRDEGRDASAHGRPRRPSDELPAVGDEVIQPIDVSASLAPAAALDEPVEPSQPVPTRGLSGGTLLGALAAAMLLGVLGAAWLLSSRGGAPTPDPAPEAQGSPPPTVQGAALAPTPEPRRAVPKPTPDPVAPATPIAGSPTPAAAAVEPPPVEPAPVEPTPVAPAPVEPTPIEPAAVEPAAVEPAAVAPVPVEPATAAPVTAAPAPEGMVAIPAGLYQPGLTDAARTMLLEMCRKNLAGYPIEWCDDRLGADKEQRGSARPIGAFFIDRTEVSQGAYDVCIAARKCSPLKLTWEVDTQPATGVTRMMAADYCAFRGGRLPTADEWAYAARGADQRVFPWGDEPVGEGRTAKANYGRFTHRGGLPDRKDRNKYAASVDAFDDRGLSAFGLLNMAGNVREWTSTEVDSKGVVMGGGWREAPFQLRVTRRHQVKPKYFKNDLGIRCVVDLQERK